MMKASRQTIVGTIGIVLASGILTGNLAQEAGAAKEPLEPSAPVATQSVSEADTIVITATRIPQSVRDVGVSVSVVPRERIEEMNAQNVAEVLAEVADARVNSYGSMGAQSEITLRGSSAKQVLVMVDGRKVNLPSMGMADLSMFPVDQVERIEVIRGPGSVLYGAGALAGVVNIVTRDPPEKMQTDVSASYGTKNTHMLQLDNGAQIGNLGYLITASQNASDGWRENSACEGYHVSGKLAYDLNLESRLTLNSGFSRQNKGVPGSINWPTPDAKQYERQYWVDLTHKYEFDTKTWLTSKAFLNQNWQEYKDPDSLTDDLSRNQTAGLDIQQTLPAGEKQLLLGGIYLENDAVTIKNAEEVSRIGGNRDLFTGAGFVQDEIELLEQLTVTPGLRCDIQSKWGAELSPKLSGLYKITDMTGLKASIGRGFRAPTVNELYWRDDYTEGNPDLKPEESFSYDAGIQQQFGKKSMLQISLFQSHMKNLIAWFDDGKGIYKAQNVNDAFLQGVETELSAQLTEEISGAVNYTLLNAQDTSGTYEDKTLTYRPKNKVGGRLGYQNAWGLKLNLNAEYTDSVYTDRANTKELGGFMTLGAYAAQTLVKGVEIFARGNNLLNKQYQLVNGYPMPGFSVMGGVKATF
ncbi:MAG: TonB-dependent receptor [Verrucomicrobia bacterium]|nr:TonB-dependent receptor [Verrucomicrobiota bacterium]MBU4291017.1 TonB-dependent receptor [Verrucomicrobiota bacterium]MBU4429900.1 TonB-dependent receptor [Verrucomicrobiota bacterium]MCG2678907.1 TonB-dependent receptor [Kiritimatiellia bacterium]